jgi:hypothetical protein
VFWLLAITISPRICAGGRARSSIFTRSTKKAAGASAVQPLLAPSHRNALALDGNHCRSVPAARTPTAAPRLARSAGERARERRSIESFRVNLDF